MGLRWTDLYDFSDESNRRVVIGAFSVTQFKEHSRSCRMTSERSRWTTTMTGRSSTRRTYRTACASACQCNCTNGCRWVCLIALDCTSVMTELCLVDCTEFYVRRWTKTCEYARVMRDMCSARLCSKFKSATSRCCTQATSTARPTDTWDRTDSSRMKLRR